MVNLMLKKFHMQVVLVYLQLFRRNLLLKYCLLYTSDAADE